ncbi:SDR family oxidoreductase [Actinomadura montaniterrae]|uniref:SDR family oxidoreductase n=2 Tax=Actinomadura montaniterrae TaxID=1803903 RepID=A0A6L3VXS0_9ACTN|nr:SDR family oxidoreductase [Actinomadura montaniterrae]
MGVLDGKVAVVTGGTSGIGAATAESLIRAGARVVLAGRRRHRGEAMAARLGAAADFVATDVSAESQVRELIAHTVERFGRLDCLVNNAGDGGSPASVQTLDLEGLRRMFDVHVLGAAAGIKCAAPIMIEQGAGSIINIGGISGRLAGWSTMEHSTVKAALLHFTRCAAAELGDYGVRVNTVSPGPVSAGAAAESPGVDADRADDDSNVLRRALSPRGPATSRPFQRSGAPRDVASAILWLANDASSFVNGHDLVVDGGVGVGRPAGDVATGAAAINQLLASS